MDTMDALHSYRDRERKLEILKDSHIGAFAVICFVMYELIYLGAVSMITEKEQILVLAAGFFLSRTLSGIGVVSLRVREQGLPTRTTDRRATGNSAVLPETSRDIL